MKSTGILAFGRIPLLLCFGGWILLSGSLGAAETRYLVQKNETLNGIARKFGISPAELMKFNRLTPGTTLQTGKVLRIPDRKPAGKNPSLAPNVRKELERVAVARRKWQYIVIHHSATESGNAKGMDRYHREERHMENGLAYHFVIGNGRGMGDGEITIGKRWLDQLNGGHLRSEALNQKSIGICLVGNFDEERPTPKQLESLRALTSYLMARCHLGVKAVRTHQEINTVYTRCPGRNFPAKTFLKDLKRSLAGQAAKPGEA